MAGGISWVGRSALAGRARPSQSTLADAPPRLLGHRSRAPAGGTLASARRAYTVAQADAQRERAAAWRGDNVPGVSLEQLAADASALARRLRLPPHDDGALRFYSEYTRADGSKRSWCHWLVPRVLMVGRYPHPDPTAHPDLLHRRCASCGGPTLDESRAHLARLLGDGARVRCFASLLDEVPAQTDDAAWPADGRCYLPQQDREHFPAPFVRYYDAVMRAASRADGDGDGVGYGGADADGDAVAAVGGEGEKGGAGVAWPLPSFVHFPMRDCAVPWSDGAARSLLADLVSRLDVDTTDAPDGRAALYVHCWSGRGRAGLIGGALLALLRPELAPAQVLRIVQAGYDSRAGAGLAPARGDRSPQTVEQRDWLENFVMELRELRQVQ
ncbi:hypothetical protein KFE25_004628 [Diacronema lutheri]|uniref:Tyrosine specific protein phosphatases domain-containing protein n=1 Tax=Diacronema lutheri TaxID=2081491 RepID=A0A8J6C5I5_DIALT|nr:hypothetical protein KFE25_004628 [Diacronema lutheri]